jgi:hypothetical protein
MNAIFALPSNGDLLEQALRVSILKFLDWGLPMTCGSIEIELCTSTIMNAIFLFNFFFCSHVHDFSSVGFIL